MGTWQWRDTIPIDKGWSEDRKYCATDEFGHKYLLRLSDPSSYEVKQAEFHAMQQIAALGLPMCLPLDLGRCDDCVYSVQSWIDGCDAKELLPSLSPEEQYHYGVLAGQYLRRLHSIPAPAGQEDWEPRFNRKLDRKLQQAEASPLKYDDGELLVQYIQSHRRLLYNRPQSLQHGDYHIGNLMIDRSGQLQIIDFNRFDYGDPWEEFNRIVWCAQASEYFASGRVNGYFDGNPPQEFWDLLALYIASNTLSSLPWAIPFGQQEIDTMLAQEKQVMYWYDGMQRTVPRWYHPGGTEV